MNILFFSQNKIKNMLKGETNFLRSENGAKVIKVSSQMQGCLGENVINNDKKVNTIY